LKAVESSWEQLKTVAVGRMLKRTGPEWIYDTGASRHLFANKELMKLFEDVANRELST